MWPMAYAMVRTVNPNARATPSRPMPTLGNAAARTALPHPPKTSQNVPINSAVALLLKGIGSNISLLQDLVKAVFVRLCLSTHRSSSDQLLTQLRGSADHPAI